MLQVHIQKEHLLREHTISDAASHFVLFNS